MADDRHPLQKLLADRALAEEKEWEEQLRAEQEAARVKAALDEAWVPVSTLMLKAVARANAVLEENDILTSFQYVPPSIDGGPALQIHDDTDLDPVALHLSLDLDALPEPRILARGHIGATVNIQTFAAAFSDVDSLLTDLYAKFTEPLV